MPREGIMAKVIGGRRLVSESEARRCLADLGRSGLSLNGWCRQHGVSYSSLYGWRRRLSEPAVPLVELVATPTPPTTPKATARYAVVVGDVQVVVGDDFADATLVRLLKVVAATC